MPLLSSYRRVLATPGALLFSATGLVARLPISMAGLGIVFLVQAGTGSYGTAGAVSAAYMVANALLAIAQGRLIDSLGQRVVLTVASVGFGVATPKATLATVRTTRWPSESISRPWAIASSALATM